MESTGWEYRGWHSVRQYEGGEEGEGMRVIAGIARRVPLRVAKGSETRPFLEMARGALFNHLAPRLPGASVLDLYAGSGALGIEALSRGASSCIFVEADPSAVRVLRENLCRCHFEDRAEILLMDVAEALSRLDQKAFDLVFFDPPFALSREGADQREGEIAASFVRSEGRLIYRCERKIDPPEVWGDLIQVYHRRYGKSRVVIYARLGQTAEGERRGGSK